MRRLARIDTVLRSPDGRLELEEFKRLMGLAAGRYGNGDREGYIDAAFGAREVALRLVSLIRAEPANATLPEEAVYRYVANVAHQELLGPTAAADDVILFELGVRFPPGRPPTRRPRARQGLLDEVRARPDMTDEEIDARGLKLDVWRWDQSDDRVNKHRRIDRVRRDAAK